MTHPVRVKICCISSVEEANLASKAGADLIGLVGPMPSGPGVLNHDAAASIVEAHAGTAQPILLTSSHTAEAITEDAAQVGVSHVQVVRHITAAEAEALAAQGLTYCQVVHVENEAALDLIARYEPFCDAFLLDSGRVNDDAFGGTGATHDWQISAEFVRRTTKPTFLAGGLTPDNVADAVAAVRPHGVDVCSGLRSKGRLDASLLDAFMTAIAKG